MARPAPPDRVCAAIEASIDWGRQTLEGFRRSPSIEIKNDNTPVTDFDRDTERRIIETLSAHFPDHGISGEEFGCSDPHNPHLWFVDPIDGTKSYIIGNPLYGTMVGYTVDGSHVAGGVSLPALGETWIADGSGEAWRVDAHGQIHRPLRCRACADVMEAALVSTGPDLFSAQQRQALATVEERVRIRRYGGDCVNYLLLAAGWVDLVIEADCAPYDIVPLAPIIEAAGGVISSWSGHPLTVRAKNATESVWSGDGLLPKTTVLAAGSAKLHSQVMELLK